MSCTYVRIVGDGRVYQGAALVEGIMFTPITGGDELDVYDGLDATSGELVFHIESADVVTRGYFVPFGVRFNHGIYLDASAADSQTTVFFVPLEL